MSDMDAGALHGIPALLHIPLFLFCFWSVAGALGWLALGWLRVPKAAFGRWEAGVISAALGAGVLQFLPYGLAVTQHMTVTALRIAALVLVLLLSPTIWRIYRALWRELAVTLRQKPRPSVVIWLVLLVLTVLPVLARAFVFRSLGDDDGYHLSAPKRWLEAGALIYLPTYTHTNAAVGFEMLYVIGLAVWNAVAAKALHFSAGLLALLGVYLCGKRLGGAVVGLLAVSLMLLPTPLYSVPWILPLAFVDFGACFMTVASILLWLVWRASPDRRLLLCMALCAGLAASMKLTYIAGAVAWVIVLSLEHDWRRASFRASAYTIISFGVVALLPVLPWLGRNWWCTGNPFYPMLAGVFPSRDWNAEQTAVFERYIHYYSWGIRSSFSVEVRKRLVLAAALAVLGSGLVAMRFTKSRETRHLLLFAALFIAPSLLLTGLYFRYLLPAIFALNLVVAAELNAWLARWRKLVWVGAIAVLGLACADYFRRPPEMLSDLRVAAGLMSAPEAQSDDSFWPMWRFINQRTPADAKLLMVAFYTTFGASSFGNFFVDRKVFATDSHLQTFIAFDEWRSFLDSLDRADIEYLVITDRQFQPGRHGFVFRGEQNEYTFCRRLVDHYGERLAQFDHLQLYRVHTDRARLE